MKVAQTIEAILFAAGGPMPKRELTTVVGVRKPALEKALIELTETYRKRGLRIISNTTTVQMVTAPELSEPVARYLQSELRGSLSPGALETLAVIAYRGPVTRSVIESIRGIQSTGPLRTLSMRGLIEETGRTNEPGRPILYGTTLELLKHLGYTSTDELPSLTESVRQRLGQLPQPASAS